MKILLHHPKESDGTSFYRAFGPFNELVRKNPEIQIVNGNTDISWEFITQFDLVFIQRPASPWHVALVNMCKSYGIPVWVDWDDHYFNIPDSNPRKHFYTEYHIDQVKWIARNVDYITVSTQFLYDAFKEYNENIQIVPNALDQRFFDYEAAKKYPREKVILWRGSDTHKEDLDFYKDEILALMDATPEYVWAFYGYYPDWAVDHLPSNRLRIYDYTGPIEFIHGVFAIRPTLVYVPMVDNEFNRSRSHVAWLEATYAGAAVVAPNWPEWTKLPVSVYGGSDEISFSTAFLFALDASASLAEASSEVLAKHFRLPVVNWIRKAILDKLMKRTPYDVYKTLHPPIELPAQFTDKEFFDYNSDHGWNQNNPDWILGQKKFADFIQNDLKAQAIIDIGCGPGALVEELLNRGLVAYGVDSNPHNYEYFIKRNPDKTEKFIQEDASLVQFGNFMDLVVCVEVFEHMPDEVCDKILANWRGKCKFFLFTSTPFHSTPEFDKQWGHINVKPKPHWVKFFEYRGFKHLQNLDYPTQWALLFIST